MVKQKQKLLLAELIGVGITIGLFIYLVLSEEPDVFIIAVGGLFPTLVPLTVYKLESHQTPEFCGEKEKLHWFLIGILSSVSLLFSFWASDLLVGCLLLVMLVFFWYIFLSNTKKYREPLYNLTTVLHRGTLVFVGIYLCAFFFYIPIRALMVGIMPPVDASFDILQGISMLCFFVFAWLVAKYRIAFLNAFVIALLWFQLDTGWIMRNWDRLMGIYLGTLIFALTVMFMLFITVACTLGRFVTETREIIKNKQSGLLGSWFSPLIKHHIAKPFSNDLKKAMKKGLKVGIILIIISSPGLLVVFDAIPVKMVIHPRTDYTMRFNFWAIGNLSYYPLAVQKSMNDLQINLDLTMGDITNDTIQTLIEFETAMPNITYRLTVAPPKFCLLAETIIQRTEILLAYEKNLTIDQWRGFVFDIEGESYNWKKCNMTLENTIAEWNDMFNYVFNNASVQRGKIIELENVGSHVFGADVLFDGDLDNQLIEGYVSNSPERFTSYAPMVYRALTDDLKCVTEPASPLSPWMTSYWIYDALYTLNGTLKDETKLGIYLGITNCSCYSRDLPQSEPISWGKAGGLENLIRDTLIAKHFGVREVTYFLQWSVSSARCGGCLLFGAFDSYGDDFLNKLNESVNTNPPKEFTLVYRNIDADLNLKLYRDVLGDVSHTTGVIFVISALFGAIFITWLAERKRTKK